MGKHKFKILIYFCLGSLSKSKNLKHIGLDICKIPYIRQNPTIWQEEISNKEELNFLELWGKCKSYPTSL